MESHAFRYCQSQGPSKKQSHDDSFEAPKLVDFLKENGEVRFRRDPYPLVI